MFPGKILSMSMLLLSRYSRIYCEPVLPFTEEPQISFDSSTGS